ncbi:MAG: DUF2726 domain-containing protein [Pseudomonadota bacterium]|nr:DUF2726 domain-containing protein [Pseudomonadota bacterium]
MGVDTEILFNLVMDKDWEQFSNLAYQNFKQLQADPLAKQALKIFEQEFLQNISDSSYDEKVKLLKWPSSLVSLSNIPFSEDFKQQVIDENLHALKATESPLLFDFAKEHQTFSSLARSIISEISDNIISGSSRGLNISLEANCLDTGPKTIKLFKSAQERNFFKALQSVYPTYLPYPNVALNSVVDFEQIKEKLTYEEREYFFKALIDFVVFHPGENYIPLYFFELDSSFHDTKEAKARDDMKNSICKAASVNLIRLRPNSKEQITEEYFEQLLRNSI